MANWIFCFCGKPTLFYCQQNLPAEVGGGVWTLGVWGRGSDGWSETGSEGSARGVGGGLGVGSELPRLICRRPVSDELRPTQLAVEQLEDESGSPGGCDGGWEQQLQRAPLC